MEPECGINSHIFLYFCAVKPICAIFIFAVYVLTAFLMFLFPGVPLVPTLLKLTGIGALAVCINHKVTGGGRFSDGIVVGVLALLSAGLVLNVWYFTTNAGGSIWAPVFVNDDALAAWTRMQEVLAGSDVSAVHSTRWGYGFFLALLSWPGPGDVVSLLLFNVFFVLITIIFTGGIALRLAGDNAPRHLAPAAMVMMSAICYFVASGVILIKDACVCALMATALYSLAGLWKRFSAVDTVLLAAAVLTAAVVRPNILLLLAAGLVVFIPGMARRSLWAAGTAVAVLAVLFIVNRTLGTASMDIAGPGGGSDWLNMRQERLRSYTAVMGDYEALSQAGRLLRLPVSLALQYITPLPWDFGRDVVFGPSSAWSHVSYPWYAVGGVVLYSLFFMLRRLPGGMARMLCYGVGLYAVTAFMTGGTISRYTLPWLPALIPAAAWAWTSACYRCRSFRIWYGCYAVLMVLALAGAFAILHKYNPGGWAAQ